MWVNNLKIAIVQKDVEKIDALLDDVPSLSDEKEIEEVVYLLREASLLVHTLKDEIAVSMEKIQKNIKFIRAAESAKKNKLDVSF